MFVINVDVTRWDLLRMSVLASARHRSTWISWLFITTLVIAIILFQQGVPTTPRNWIVMIVAGAVGGAAGLVAGSLFSLIVILAMSKQSNGVLGRHTFTLRDDGLLEQMQANDTLINWAGARKRQRTRNA